MRCKGDAQKGVRPGLFWGWPILLVLSMAFLSMAFAGPVRAQDEAAPPLEKEYIVTDFRFEGLGRISEAWLRDYLDRAFPARMTEKDAIMVRTQVLTTAVVTEVTTEFIPDPVNQGAHLLVVRIEEKWTTIPVIRGAIGGGTPLRVFGVYDINAFGKLMTLGAETRKYGDAPPGFVLYFRDPRAASGRYYLGAEFWRNFRSRQFFRKDGEPLGTVATNATIGRINLLRPLFDRPSSEGKYASKFGLDIRVVEEAPVSFDEAPENLTGERPQGIAITSASRLRMRLLPQYVYDDVDIDNVQMDGVRAILRAGPVIDGPISDGDRVHAFTEAEVFSFYLMPRDVNFAIHAVIGQSTNPAPESQFYLGGFDTVRGLPDGVVFGTRAAYLNAEIRHLSLKTKYLWIQNIAFLDAGGAGQSWEDAASDPRSAIGFGLRFSIPQVYRLVFRIDYAWAIDGSGNKGFSAGMNQFFQPYRPL